MAQRQRLSVMRWLLAGFDDFIDFVVVPSLESIACNIFATKQGLEFGVWEWGHQHALWDVHRHTYNAKQKNISRPSLAVATLPGVIRADGVWRSGTKAERKLEPVSQ